MTHTRSLLTRSAASRAFLMTLGGGGEGVAPPAAYLPAGPSRLLGAIGVKTSHTGGANSLPAKWICSVNG